LQPTLGDELAAGRKSFFLAAQKLAFRDQVVVRRDAHDLSAPGVFQEKRSAIGRGAENFAKLSSAVGPHQHALAAGVIRVGNARTFSQKAHLPITDNISARHIISPKADRALLIRFRKMCDVMERCRPAPASRRNGLSAEYYHGIRS
jgi:hypothetical protein